MRGLAAVLFALTLPAWLAGCSSARNQADALAAGRGMRSGVVDGGRFDLYTLRPRAYVPDQPLSVYIEGDGYAFITRYRLNDDPTPRHPVAMELAAKDPAANVAYVARPCQYVTGPHRRNCEPAYWSVARYSEEVVAATNAVIDRLMAESGAHGLRLYGYSGGATVALLVAARRSDVVGVVTVAGLLDTEAWTQMDGLAPLSLSLNPADLASRLVNVPQLHLVGADDGVVPEAVARAYASHFPPDHRPLVRVVPGEGHSCCWSERWPDVMGAVP